MEQDPILEMSRYAEDSFSCGLICAGIAAWVIAEDRGCATLQTR